MNKRPIYIGIIYCILVIIYKLIILLGGYQLTRFGFYYSHIISVFFILPFMIWAIKSVRDKDRGGVIGGRDAIKAALGVFAVAVIILSVYTYIEFEWKMRDISVQYYNGAEYHEFLKKQTQLSPDDYQKVIIDNIKGLSAIKAVTAKLFSFFLLSLSMAFITAVFMKRR